METIVVCNCAIVLVLCVAGLKTGYYRENWLQHFGLWLKAFAAISIFWQAYFHDDTSWHDVLLTSGMSLYLLGTATKVWRHRSDPA